MRSCKRLVRSKIVKLILPLAVLAVSCECSSQRDNPSQNTEEELRPRNAVEARKDFLEKERAAIQAYLKDRDLKMDRTGTGLHYQILRDSAAEEIVEPEDEVEFEYDIYLMNGRLLYSSEERGNRSLRVDKEDAEIGLHESLKLLGLGDKGRFILPSHLAFGVGGDQERIPPMTPLVYEIKVVNIQKSNSG